MWQAVSRKLSCQEVIYLNLERVGITCDLSIVQRFKIILTHARVAELVDARDLKSLACIRRAGSTPAPGTMFFTAESAESKVTQQEL